MAINLTGNAAKRLDEILKEINAKEGKNYPGVRLKLSGGGCSGFQYNLALDDPKEKDKIFEQFGMKVYVDPKSHIYLEGTEIDYIDGLMGAGFTFKNPKAKGTCGCGSSFNV